LWLLTAGRLGMTTLVVLLILTAIKIASESVFTFCTLKAKSGPEIHFVKSWYIFIVFITINHQLNTVFTFYMPLLSNLFERMLMPADALLVGCR
jgi:hypothetical protein